ncbi:MAG TPA: ABC transporter ATP-binding protein [Flavobacteriales bacterium]|nr:ABC transporter ATP-binding protein [Flavobacteriales bacterium]
MTTPLFEARNISKNYGNYRALDDVSISVEQGSVFGLLGPNGAGKTSLIRIINQITIPDAGELLFKGKPMVLSDVQRIGYLPEERGLYKKMQVGEQCLYLARLRGLDKQEAKRRLRVWFEKFEMQSWWNKKIEELSKGMAQKVQFVVTVLHEPELLIFDEPFSGFDPVNASIIRNEILELRKKGATIIFSTHRMETVEELCDSIALINKSKKILDGKVRDIQNEFRTNTFEVEFRGNMLAFTTAMWAGFELLEKHTEGNFCKVRLRMLGNNNVNSLFQAVMPVCEIVSFREVIPTMDEIFIRNVQSSI